MKEIWVKTMNNNKNHKSIEEKVKSKNKRLKAVKNLKISLRVAQLVAPYIISLGLPIGIFKLSGKGIPFNLESIEHNPVIMKEFDTLGNEKIEKQYDSFNISTNLIRHYTELEKDDTGVYTREIETYKLNEENLDKIEQIMKTDYDELNEILGEPMVVSEIKNNPTNEELKTKDYLQAVVYSKDYDDVLVEKETKNEDLGLTIIEGVAFLISSICIIVFRHGIGYSFKKQIANIKEKYKPIDEESLEKEPNKKLVK